METTKQLPVVTDAKTGRRIEWLAKTTLSDRGSVTIAASDALKAANVKSQLEAVRRIRERLVKR